MAGTERTISYVEDQDDRDRSFVAPYLVLAMECTRPLIPPARFSVAEVDQVLLGRGGSRAHRRYTESGRSVLRIELPDVWMSSRHVDVRKHGKGWVLRDAGSKNGTFINGMAVTEQRLVDGDLIEAGNTMFLFRSKVRREFNEPADVDAAHFRESHFAAATLSIPLARSYSALARFAPSEVPIIIGGETGTGKEVTAQMIHQLSGREGPLAAINCGALPSTLIESELFGYKKGAFSGATEERPGRIRAADGGTLFLDEIAELPEASQVKLLRVLQERQVVPLGGTRPVEVDIRVVAATHQDIGTLVEDGKFRKDLYARLAGYELVLPPLRERREDIGLLVATLLHRICENPRSVKFQRSAARALFDYEWPLNIRELEQCLRSAVTLAAGEPIAVEHLPPTLRGPTRGTATAANTTLGPEDQAVRDGVIEALKKHRGNVSAVARELGKARVQIRRWCKRFGIDVKSFRR